MIKALKNLFSAPLLPSQLKQPLTTAHLFSQFDIFYVCFDEPNRFQNWKQIKELLPKVRKIEGVVGFDRALKVCASEAKSSHFFVIDGDNQILENRLQRPVINEPIQDHWVLSWASMNTTNGLLYGNGGLKLWPRDVALNIKSHEIAQHDKGLTDYCFLADYYQVRDFVTHTIINSNPRQAFRAGFREGVKMSLVGGKQARLTYESFASALPESNLARLKVWCEVGADSPFGHWAILGARSGFKANAIDNFDCELINSYECIDEVFDGLLKTASLDWDQVTRFPLDTPAAILNRITELGEELNEKFPISLILFSPEASLQFKKEFKNPSRSGLMFK